MLNTYINDGFPCSQASYFVYFLLNVVFTNKSPGYIKNFSSRIIQLQSIITSYISKKILRSNVLKYTELYMKDEAYMPVEDFRFKGGFI